MTQQDFSRMTAVIDKWIDLGLYYESKETCTSEGRLAFDERACTLENAAADLLEALPVPEDK